MNKMIFSLISLQLLVGSTDIFAQQIKTWKIGESKVSCSPGGAKECYWVRKGNMKGWEVYTGKIDNFNYVEGNQYKIKVEESSLKNTAKLISIVSTKNVSNNVSENIFDWNELSQNLAIIKVNGTDVVSNRAYFSLNLKENRVFGNGGCNGFHGSVSLNNNTMRIGSIMSTMMACAEGGIDKQESEILRGLENKTLEVKQNGSFFSIYNGSHEVLLLKAQTASDVSTTLTNHFWQLTSLNNVGKDYGKMGLHFDIATNKISGYGGCNRFFGDVTITKDRMQTQALATTLMACLSDEKTKDESTFYNLMNKANFRFDLIGSTLYLYSGSKTVATFQKQAK